MLDVEIRIGRKLEKRRTPSNSLADKPADLTAVVHKAGVDFNNKRCALKRSSMHQARSRSLEPERRYPENRKISQR